MPFTIGHKINLGRKRLPFTKETKKKLSLARIGISPSNKGIPMSEKQKELLRKLSKRPERIKIAITNLPKDCKGEKNGNWKGGIKYFETRWGKYKHYNKSSEYLSWRLKVFERDNWTCQNCGKRGHIGLGESVYLEAHHIKKYTKYPELRFNLDNGIALCRECHKLIHKKY